MPAHSKQPGRAFALSFMLALAALHAPVVAQTPSEPAGKDVLSAALAPRSGGLTPERAARRALGASATLREKTAEREAAEARVDQARVGFAPTVTASSSYVRYSPVNDVVTTATCPDDPNLFCQLTPEEAEGQLALIPATVSPQYLDQYNFTTSLVVPLTDYVHRIPQQYKRALADAAAHTMDARAAELGAATNAKLVLYEWVEARGQLVVANLGLAQSREHLKLTEDLLPQGMATRADTLKLEARVANSQREVARARTLLRIAETRLRIAIGARPRERMEIGFDVFQARPTAPVAARALVRRALARRIGLRALDEYRRSWEAEAAVARSAYGPRVEAFANGHYLNPNRRQLPVRDRWEFAWDVGVRLSWTVNDTFRAAGRAAEAEAEARKAMAQRAAAAQLIRLEVEEAHAGTTEALVVIEAAQRQLKAAEDGLSARRELLLRGEADAIDIVDDEAEVNAARLALLTGYVEYHMARVRLEHATGANVRDEWLVQE